MLNVAIFLPLLTGIIVLMMPRDRADLVRWIALGGSLATLAVVLVLWIGYDTAGEALQWRTSVAWIPWLGARYDVAVNGISLALILLTAILLSAVAAYVLRAGDRARAHAFLFLVLGTGLIGLFSAQDLLLFYVFFEIGLVPMYFIIGLWGQTHRRYAAAKFFMYTRVAALAMLLGFLALYLAMEPRTFSLPAMIAARPLADAPLASALVFAALLVGFGLKMPIVPLHNWLPDAHVEAPTEGSVILAGIQLKIGGYGLIAVLLPLIPEATARFGWLIVLFGLISLIYGALAAMAQTDLKRLIAYTSINHMGFVILGVGIAAMATVDATRQLALNGAAIQMVSHGLLTGGMFLIIGILQHRAETREMTRFGGLFGRAPQLTALLCVLSFGSLGLPGLSGFIGEFQVLAAILEINGWAAAIVVLALLITTGLYLRVIGTVLMGGPTPNTIKIVPLDPHERWAVIPLAALSIIIGLLPAVLIPWIVGATRHLAAF